MHLYIINFSIAVNLSNAVNIFYLSLPLYKGSMSLNIFIKVTTKLNDLETCWLIVSIHNWDKCVNLKEKTSSEITSESNYICLPVFTATLLIIEKKKVRKMQVTIEWWRALSNAAGHKRGVDATWEQPPTRTINAFSAPQGSKLQLPSRATCIGLFSVPVLLPVMVNFTSLAGPQLQRLNYAVCFCQGWGTCLHEIYI